MKSLAHAAGGGSVFYTSAARSSSKRPAGRDIMFFSLILYIYYANYLNKFCFFFIIKNKQTIKLYNNTIGKLHVVTLYMLIQFVVCVIRARRESAIAAARISA